jgi:peptidylprolyl isomerase
MPEKKLLIGEGDVVSVDYVARVKESNEIFDLTLERTAKKEKVWNEKRRYEPRILVLGKGMIVKGVEKALIGKREGDNFKVEVDPEQGFGRRDASLLKIIPLKEFKRRDMLPYPGMRVDFEGLLGTIRSVTGGRVVVDFNHPLAGKALSYEIWVRKVFRGRKEKIRAIIKLYAGEELDFSLVKNSIKVIIPKDKDLLKPQKERIFEDLSTLARIKMVEFVHLFEKDKNIKSN